MNTRSGGVKTAVLVADDDPVCRLFCIQTLTAAGYRTLAAGTGYETIQTALRAQPQAIVIDIHLPDMSGAAVVSRLLESWPQTQAVPRFIGITGDDSTRLRAALLTAGFAAVLTKPFVIAALLTCLRKMGHQQFEDAATEFRPAPTRCPMATMAPAPRTGHSVQEIFCYGLNRQLSALDRAITALDWQRASDILHRLSGAAAIAGFPAFASRGRRLLQQLSRPQDATGLAEAYLDFLRQAAEPDMDPGHTAGLRFRQRE